MPPGARLLASRAKQLRTGTGSPLLGGAAVTGWRPHASSREGREKGGPAQGWKVAHLLSRRTSHGVPPGRLAVTHQIWGGESLKEGFTRLPVVGVCLNRIGKTHSMLVRFRPGSHRSRLGRLSQRPHGDRRASG